MASLFELDIAKLRGVGEKRAKLFQKLGAPTVGDLLRLYPRDYVDWTAPLPIAGAPLDGPVVVRGEIVSGPSEVRARGGHAPVPGLRLGRGNRGAAHLF